MWLLSLTHTEVRHILYFVLIYTSKGDMLLQLLILGLQYLTPEVPEFLVDLRVAAGYLVPGKVPVTGYNRYSTFDL